jgi:hypothetical protein
MSQSIIRRNNRTKSTDDEDNDDKVKYLTPRKYRTAQRTPLSNINDDIQINKNEYTLTPTKYRSKNSYEDSNTKLLYNKYPIIIGDFTLTEKPLEDNSIYNYKPKHTQISYVYQGTASGSQVQERAMNEMKQYLQSSSPIKKKIPFVNNKNHYQSMLTFPSNNYRSATDNDLIINHSRDSIHESIRRRNHSFSSLYPSKISNKSIEQYDPYYFGEKSEYIISDNDEEEKDSSSEDEKCITLGRDSQSKPIIKYSNFVPPIINTPIDIIFQKVIDTGTSTDDLLSDIITDDRRDESLDQQQSLVTNQSSRSETETYRVSKQLIDHNNYEEPDTVPFPTVKHPPSISSSSSSTIRPIKSNNYEINSVDTDHTLKNNIDEQETYYVGDNDDDDEEEESHQSITISKPIRRLPKQNPIVNLPTIKYENVNNTNPEQEQNFSHKSIKSDKSRRSFFNLFNRNKKKDEKTDNKKKDEKSKNKKKEKKKRKT